MVLSGHIGLYRPRSSHTNDPPLHSFIHLPQPTAERKIPTLSSAIGPSVLTTMDFEQKKASKAQILKVLPASWKKQ